MMVPDHLGLFMAAGVVLNLTPGPDVLYIVSQSLRGGVRPGLVACVRGWWRPWASLPVALCMWLPRHWAWGLC